MELGANVETAIGGAGVLTFLAAMARAWFVKLMTERPQLASAAAVAEQFKALQEQLASQQTEIRELRAEVSRMDVTIHRQQTKLTRTEMLLRQFVGLVQQHGIAVPPYMQVEVDDLLRPEV